MSGSEASGTYRQAKSADSEAFAPYVPVSSLTSVFLPISSSDFEPFDQAIGKRITADPVCGCASLSLWSLGLL